MTALDLKQAIDCARITATLYHGRQAPRRLLDHLAHLEDMARSAASGTQFSTQTEELDHDLIGSVEAGRILGCSPRYVSRIHTDLDGRRIGGRWVFDRKAVLDYATEKGQRRTA